MVSPLGFRLRFARQRLVSRGVRRHPPPQAQPRRNMKKSIAVVAALASLCCFPQHALATSAQELLSACRPISSAPVTSDSVAIHQTFQTGFCWGTFQAIQRISTNIDESRRRIYSMCTPEDGRLSQLIAIFVSFAEKNPQRLHEDGFDIALESLRRAFPCR